MSVYRNFCVQRGAVQADLAWTAILQKTAADAQHPLQPPAGTPAQPAPTQPMQQENQTIAPAGGQQQQPGNTPQQDRMSGWDFHTRVLLNRAPPAPAPTWKERGFEALKQYGDVPNHLAKKFDSTFGTGLSQYALPMGTAAQQYEKNMTARIRSDAEAAYATARQTGNYAPVWAIAQKYPAAFKEMHNQAVGTAKKWGAGLAIGGLGLAAMLPFLWNNDDEAKQQAVAKDPNRMDAYRLS